ncbi:MAG TPA: CARDB domain-containing protein [Pyrinomonadaceae bacterium]
MNRMKLIFAALLVASAAAPAFSQGEAKRSAPRSTRRDAATFALVATRFKNAGGNYSQRQSQFPAPTDRLKARPGQPDLLVEQFVFAGEKALRVRVANVGSAPSGPCVLRLTVRKINGVAVGRTTEVKLLPIAAGKDRWVAINAKSILPNNIALDSTTFRLNADATAVVAETNEDNNEVWHNL